ncbi:hypothetical protein GALL_82980 [mine drainage metagenome]|uniref:DUF4124 domain-containing protein n=1 Tax=mine drainage metagenome TaxID=410659 RepID=A0A1J5T6L6_9ZZZZ
MKHYLFVIALSILSLNAHAALNKWVDAEGKVHYSDTPPPDVTTETVRNIAGKERAEAPAAHSPKSAAEREAEMKKSKKAQEEAAQKQAQKDAETEAKKKNCAAARESSQALEQSPRIVTYDANGNPSFMDDATRAQRLEDARKTISSSCD